MLEKDLYNFREPLIFRRQIEWTTPILVPSCPICAAFEKYPSDFCTLLWRDPGPNLLGRRQM
jgi:hypothetical protein